MVGLCEKFAEGMFPEVLEIQVDLWTWKIDKTPIQSDFKDLFMYRDF